MWPFKKKVIIVEDEPELSELTKKIIQDLNSVSLMDWKFDNDFLNGFLKCKHPSLKYSLYLTYDHGYLKNLSISEIFDSHQLFTGFEMDKIRKCVDAVYKNFWIIEYERLKKEKEVKKIQLLREAKKLVFDK